MRERWEKMADDIGIERTVDIADLTYNDEHRAELSGLAPTTTGGPPPAHHRPTRCAGLAGGSVPGRQDEDAFSTFVVAERRG